MRWRGACVRFGRDRRRLYERLAYHTAVTPDVCQTPQAVVALAARIVYETRRRFFGKPRADRRMYDQGPGLSYAAESTTRQPPRKA